MNLSTTTWQVVETSNIKMVSNLLAAAKSQSLFMGISDIAGCGKSCITKLFARNYATQGVFYLECSNWGRRDFLTFLCESAGIERKVSDAHTIPLIVRFFNDHASLKPLLILDEADKLKSAALQVLIPLYNGCEGQLGVMISGVPNLEKQFKTGVLRNRQGYDELSSRFGRRFFKLPGTQRDEVFEICRVNGIVNKKTQEAIFKECEPSSVVIKDTEGKEVIVQKVYDMRRLRRIVERELLKIKNKAIKHE